MRTVHDGIVILREWASRGIGDPDQGFGRKQPGSWMFSLLPFAEEGTLFDHASGQPGWPVPVSKRVLLDEMHETPVGLYYCPSRRPARAYPTKSTFGGYLPGNWTHDGGPLARNDYAASLGTQPLGWPQMHPTYHDHETYVGWPDRNFYDGVIFMRSEVRLSEIRDGSSHTYLVGEKYLNPDKYEGGTDYSPGDDEGCFIGQNGDCVRSTSPAPAQDTPGADLFQAWGSAHYNTFQMTPAEFVEAELAIAVGVVQANRLGGGGPRVD